MSITYAQDRQLLPNWQTQHVVRITAGESDLLYTDYISENRPVIIDGLADSWPAKKRWTRSWLKANHGQAQVPVLDIQQMQVLDMTLAQYLDQLEAGVDRLYLIDWSLPKTRPELLLDLKQVDMARIDWLSLKEGGSYWPTLFIGPKGSFTGFHVDTFGSHAWNTVLWGKKLFLLISPQDIATLEEAGNQSPETFKQALTGDIFYRDVAQIPGMTQITPQLAQLEAGQTLYTPEGWLHTVINLEDTLAVTGNWVDECCRSNAFAELEPDVFSEGLRRAQARLETEDLHLSPTTIKHRLTKLNRLMNL